MAHRPICATVAGHVEAGFEPVREAFAANFAERGELGGACCVYRRGEKVVDLWGGLRNAATREPWEEDTMVIVYSTTKGLAAMTLALAPRCSPRSGRPGSRARARATTRSRSATTRASCCAGSTRSTAAWGASSRTRSPRRSASTSTSACPTYGVFAAGGRELGLRAATLQALSAPASPPTRGDYDECMLSRGVGFSLGFMQHGPIWPFGSESAFGFPGSGGSLGFADPEAAIGYAYVTSRMGTALTGDPREVALRNALYAALRS